MDGRSSGSQGGFRRCTTSSIFIAAAIPLDPPIVDPSNLDAFGDSLGGGVEALGVPRLALIWPEPETMVRGSPKDFKEVVDLLVELTLHGHDPAEAHRVVLVVGGDHYLGPTRDFT
jgi:hypothetical protein